MLTNNYITYPED